MDLNFSHDSFAFSDIAPPSHVSDLESFSDFDVSETSEASFVGFAPKTATEYGEQIGTPSEACNVLATKEKGKFSLGLQELNATNIQDFLAAIKSANTQGFLASDGTSGTSLLSGDNSSLGILQLDALSNLSDNLQNMSLLDKESTQFDRTLVGDDQQAVLLEKETEDPGDDLIEDDIPFATDYTAAGIVTPVFNRNMQAEKRRPDTGQDPDTFFSPQNEEIINDVNSNADDKPSQLSYGQEELRVMLQRRSGSGDGGELIDRVSLTSSISFIQSQTFPDSVFSQSFSSTSRGLGSGMDSRSGSDDNDDDGDNTLPPSLHGAGDGSNDSIGRPGLEGANSDVEDPPVLNRTSLGTSVRQETQGLGLRQSAEGDDVGPFVPGDGGGGGDGSSGNSSDADDGRPPVGASYDSSSTSSLPPTTIPTTAHQITSSSLQFVSSLHGGDEAMSADRGCPVGDVDAERSPVLLPSPPNQLNAMAANLISTPYPIHLQATSTPLVKQEGQPDSSAVVHDETSALESCYLPGKQTPSDFTFGNSFHSALGDGRSFAVPKAQNRRTANSLTEAESLNFEVSASEASTGRAFMQDRNTTLMPCDSGTRNVKFGKEESRQGQRLSSSRESDFIDQSSIIDDSQLWKSTPRDDELSGTRATPGIVFKGHQRPSTVTGQAYVGQCNSKPQIEEGDSQTSLTFLNSQTIIEPGLERTLTPGMAAGHNMTSQPSDWLTDKAAPSPWSPGEFGTRDSIPGSNPFDNEAPPRGTIDAPSWTLGMDLATGGNPFDDEGFNDYQNSFDVVSDFDFQPQGDAEAILAADEEKFKKEHQFDLLPQTQIDDTSKLHDWTIPDGQYVNRPSLLRVIGINDPNDLGEVRVSFGRFLAARSEELGSLSRTSPDRPRPTFGNDKPIITPPKQVTKTAEISSARTSLDESFKEDQHLDQRKSDKSSQRLPKHNQAPHRQAGSRHGTRTLSDSVSIYQQGNPSLEMKKAQLDEQYRREVRAKSRSRSNSQTSSRSSSSRSSVKSVIKNDSDVKEQTALSKRSTVDDNRSKGRSRKRSDRKDKREGHKSDQLSEVSYKSQNSGNRLQGFPLVSDKGLLNTVGRCLSSEDNAASLESLSQFIADAINEDPDKIRRQLAAVASAKANARLKKKQQSLSTGENIEKNSTHKSQEFNPLASSSPQSTSSKEKEVYAHDQDTIHVMSEVELPSRSPLEDSVFPLQGSPSQAPLSLKELDAKGSSPSFHESVPPSEKGIFKHVIPQFGETYTLRNAQNCQKSGVPVVDPLGHRAHEIEQRLDQSLPPNDQSYATNANFPEVVTREPPHPSSARDVSTQYATPGGRNQKLDTSFDSAVESMLSSVSKPTSVNRHSWPDAASSQQQKSRDFTPKDHANNTTTSGSQETGYKTLVERVSAPSAYQVTRPADPGPTIENVRAGVQPQNQFSGAPPIQTSLLGANTNIPATMATVLAGHTMPALSGFACHNGPAIGPLSQTASAGFGSGMLSLGSIAHPTQGFGMLNTLPNHVPLVQTVSANVASRPSSLTSTYVQSFGSGIAYNMNNQQLPLHLQTGTSSIAVLPSSISQPTVHTSVPFMQTPLPQVNNGLLQVRPDLQGGATLMSSTPVILPGDVKFPPVCCVGVLTETVIPLHNSSSRWMHCEIHSTLSTSNGVQVPSSASAFSIQPKAIIAPHTTENVKSYDIVIGCKNFEPEKISVEPKEPGTFMTRLEVYSFPVVCDAQPVTHSLGPVLALEIVAEEPRVEVLLEEGKAIDFGEVSSGAKHCKPLRLINRCRAQVPVRIIISANSSSLHCFAFAQADFSPKTDVLVGPSVTMSKGAALTIHTLTLKGQLDMSTKVEPTIVWILFQSPKKVHADSSSSGQPDEHLARLDVEIDSAQQGPTISSILLKAQSGVVKLHTPHKLQVINLSTSVGKRATRTIPVKNAGNITARVELRIEGDLQKFSVRPTQLLLKPEQESEVQLAYLPTDPDNEVESTLVLTVPDGPVYEVLIKGSVVPEEDDSSVLLSSKPVLCWGGVNIGSSQQQKVVLKTSSTSPVKKLQLQIEGNHSDFQIQPTFHSLVDNPENPVVMLGPQKELPVHVVFSPSSMGLISSALVIKSLTGKTKSKIPLYGCGGTSQLVLLDIRQLSEGYVANVGEVSLGKKNAVKITVRNSGTRAAFVKAMCYSDIHSLQLYPSSHLNIYPNNFVLSERTSKQVMIEYQPTEKDAVRCRKAVNFVAVVAFYTGDELFRRQYKYHLERNPQQQLFETKEGSLLAGINFTSTFQDEDKLIEDVRYPKVPNWDNFFQGCVSRLLLTLVGSPPVSNAPNRSDPNSSVDIVPISDNPASANKQQHPIADGNLEGESWTVIPEQLILSPPLSKSDKGNSERLEIINFSARPLGFEFTWPAHSIIITPERGDIPPRSQTRVLVSAKSNLFESRIQFPWAGTIYLKCDGSQKAIKVQIREELILDSSPYHPGSVSFQAIPTTTAGNTPLPIDHLPPLKIKNKDVEFVKTQIGKVSTSEIVATNTTPSDLRWDLSSLAPAYVKVDETGNIFRSTYPAFHVGRHSGSVESGKTIQIAVKFQPRNVGQYSQSWDLQILPNTSKLHHHFKQRISLHGQAVGNNIDSDGANDDADVPATVATKKVTITEPPRSPPPGPRKGLYLPEDVIQFPLTPAGQSSLARVKICNDSEDSYLVRAAPPSKPFFVQHMKFSVRPKRFVRLPIKFSPTEPGVPFETLLVFTSQPDIILTVKLQATSGN